MSDPTPLSPIDHHGVPRWTTTWRDDDGRTRKKRFGVVGKVGRTEARARFKAWVDELAEAAKAAAVAPAYTVADLCREHYAAVTPQYVGPDGEPTATVAKVRIALESFGTMHGHRDANAVTPADVHAWLRRYVNEPRQPTHRVGPPNKRATPRTAATVNDALGRIKTMFEWGAVHRGVNPLAAGGAKLVRGVRGTDPAVRVKEKPGSVMSDAMEATCEELPPALADLVRVMWWTGCRPGEACRLRWVDIDRSAPVWVYAPAHHKTAWRGKVRVVAIGPKAQDVLNRHPSPQVSLPIFRDPAGKPYTTTRVRNFLASAGRRAGVGRWTPNMVRHAFTNRVRLLHGAEAVQAVLGHRRINEQLAYMDKTVAMAAKVAGEVG